LTNVIFCAILFSKEVVEMKIIRTELIWKGILREVKKLKREKEVRKFIDILICNLELLKNEMEELWSGDQER